MVLLKCSHLTIVVESDTMKSINHSSTWSNIFHYIFSRHIQHPISFDSKFDWKIKTRHQESLCSISERICL